MGAKNKKKILVLAWYYPPGNSSEGMVTYKLLKNSSFDYIVVTRSNPNANMWDRQIKEKNLKSPNVEVVQHSAANPKEWIDFAVNYYERNKENISVLMTRSMGVEPHEAGLIIKAKHPDVKWLASFGDPLVDTPYIRYVEKEENPFFAKKIIDKQQIVGIKKARVFLSPVRNARRFVWEHERAANMKENDRLADINDAVFADADGIILNNNYQLELGLRRKDFEKYRNKCFVVPHSFDDDLYPKDDKTSRDDKINFVYVGHLDELRNCNSLIHALGELGRERKDFRGKVSFDFYGHMADMDKAAIIDEDVTNIVHVHKDINYIDSLRKIIDADWALCIDADLRKYLKEYIYLPAKLSDYIGAKKKIFAITQTKGATADFIKETKSGIVVSYDKDSIKKALEAIVYGEVEVSYDNNERMKYDARKVAKKFDDKITDILGGEK